MNLCAVKYCRNLTNHKYCYKHAKRLYRAKYPLKTAFQNLRSNARRRGKDFELTLAEFELFCVKTKYIQGKGKTKDSFSIDRIDETKGYCLSNIRVLSLSENTRRRYLEYDWMSRMAKVHTANHEVLEGVPF